MTSDQPSSCGCENTCGASEEPIACTLVGRDQQLKRAAEFRDAFVHLERTETILGGFRWHFRADAALEARLRDLASREQACCKFFDFRITREANTLVWETRAASAAAAVLEEFKRLPETLAAGSSLDALTRALSDAGLRFGDVSDLMSAATRTPA